MEMMGADELLQPALPCGLNAVYVGKVHLAPRWGPRQLSRSRVAPTCPSVGELLDAGCVHALLEGPVDVLRCLHTRQARLCSENSSSVNNQGTPIPPEDLPHLFEQFYCSDKARAQETGGFELGLTIAKSIAETHGGTIGVTSDADHGTTFTVRLPKAQTHDSK
ncbi:MAG: sensor histidine kinase [Coriobacteriaceae bacterium]